MKTRATLMNRLLFNILSDILRQKYGKDRCNCHSNVNKLYKAIYDKADKRF